MLGVNFPNTGEYKIVDGETISRTGVWWFAILLLEDESRGVRFLSMYKWQNKKGEWKKHSNFRVNSMKHAAKVSDIVRRFSEKLT
jgi:hypothetical protein